jgi:hypothetical protein
MILLTVWCYIRLEAELVAGTYHRKATPEGAEKCPICQSKRSNLSAHLLRVHKISKKSPDVAGTCGTKADKVKRLAEGPFAKVDEVLLRYEEEYFTNLDGARQSLKPETAAKTKKRKLQALRQQLYWLVKKSGLNTMDQLLANVSLLGKKETGYYDSCSKMSSDRGQFLFQIFSLHMYMCKKSLSLVLESFCCMIPVFPHISFIS